MVARTYPMLCCMTVNCRYSRGEWMALWNFSEAGRNISLGLVA